MATFAHVDSFRLETILQLCRPSERSAAHLQGINSTALTPDARSATLSCWDSRTEISDEASYALSLPHHRYLRRRAEVFDPDDYSFEVVHKS
jgi:hypothetical protein